MPTKFEHSGSFDSNHPMQLNVRYCNWPIVLSDQWFLPRFKVSLENKGRRIRRGSIDFEISDMNSVNSISGISSYKGPFQDVLHKQVDRLEPGEERKFTFKVQSRFLRPGSYFLRAVFNEWIPSDSPIKELSATLRQTTGTEDQLKLAKQHAMKFFEESGIDPYARPVNQFKSQQLFDVRFIEVIKVHSLASVAAILGGFIGGVIAVFGAATYAIIKLIANNWAAIQALF